VLTAVTWTVIVTAPPLGSVTEPAIVVPLMLKLPVMAPPLTWLPRLVAPANWLGSTSLKVALVTVDGPLLLITKLKVVLAPVATVVVLLSLLTVRLTVGITKIAAVAVKEFVPTDVVKAPEAIVFVAVPPSELVTTAVRVQVEAGAITVPMGRVREPAPAAADTAPEVQPTVEVTDGEVLTRPAG
jgi:hypothetical protein